MRSKKIAVPGVGIYAAPHFYGGNIKKPAYYEYWFVLWDLAEQSTNWFDHNREEIVCHYLDSIDLLYPDYTAAFDLHRIRPRCGPFDKINFAQLTYTGEEVGVSHDLGAGELPVFHLLFVRRVADDYILNGGLFAIIDEELPAEWSEVAEEDRQDFFEVRVPADQFEVAYTSAVERFHREQP